MKFFRLLKPSVCLLIALLPSLSSAQLIVAHRGASHDAPENTMAAFKLAWEQGADAIEGDFHLTSDRQIVCVHDKDTQRVCPNKPNLTIADTDLTTLQGLDVGSWKDAQFANEKMPTLKEVLATVPNNKKIFIEIKSGPEILTALERELSASELNEDQIVIISFNAEVIEGVRQRMPKYCANWLTSYKLKKDADNMMWMPTQGQVLETLARTGATGLGSNGNENVVTDAFVTAMVDAGFEFHAWTIDDPAQALRLSALGVHSLTTNRPKFLRQKLLKSEVAQPKDETSQRSIDSSRAQFVK